jgi:hypothetical protein
MDRDWLLDWLLESEGARRRLSLGYRGLVKVRAGRADGAGFSVVAGLLGIPSGVPATKVKEEVLGPNMEPLGEEAKSEGLETKVLFVCLKKEDRLGPLFFFPEL